MKKSTLMTAFAAAALLFSCKKNDARPSSESYASETTMTDDNGKIDSATSTSMTTETDGKTMETYSYPYKASDGSRAKATFTNNGKSRTVTIEANNNKFQLDYKDKTAKGERYERSGIAAETKGDSLIITQDNNVIALVRVQ